MGTNHSNSSILSPKRDCGPKAGLSKGALSVNLKKKILVRYMRLFLRLSIYFCRFYSSTTIYILSGTTTICSRLSCRTRRQSSITLRMPRVIPRPTCDLLVKLSQEVPGTLLALQGVGRHCYCWACIAKRNCSAAKILIVPELLFNVYTML